MESSSRMHHCFARLYELLRDENGSTSVSDGIIEIQRSNPQKRWSLCVDRQNSDGHKGADAPLLWRKPRRIFVNSMSDLFHEDVSAEFVGKIWDVMRRTPQHTYQILTKRPDRMRAIVSKIRCSQMCGSAQVLKMKSSCFRIDELREVPAVVRFISFEPLLGSVLKLVCKIYIGPLLVESGPRARPMHEKWVREIKAKCREEGVAFFFKQWGGKNKKKTGRQLSGRTFDEMPSEHVQM